MEVDLKAVAQNTRSIKKFLGPKVVLLAIVKANAYGHGLVEISKVAVKNGAGYLGVARVEEGIRLRESRVRAPILITAPIPTAAAEEAVRWKLTPSVSSLELLRALSAVAARRDVEQKVHIKVDTGLTRNGILYNQAAGFIQEVLSAPHIKIEGLFTHFASAEDDFNFTRLQGKRFAAIVRETEEKYPEIKYYHAANSPATLKFPDFHFRMVRVGRAIYGLSPIPKLPPSVRLKPSLAFKSRVMLIKDIRKGDSIGYGRTFRAPGKMRTALISCGYADGLPRAVSNVGSVLIRGRKCRILGRVSMDQVTADISRLKGVRIGDEVVLIGRQGREEITVDQLAAWAGTIAHEVLVRIGPRVPRIYV